REKPIKNSPSSLTMARWPGNSIRRSFPLSFARRMPPWIGLPSSCRRLESAAGLADGWAAAEPCETLALPIDAGVVLCAPTAEPSTTGSEEEDDGVPRVGARLHAGVISKHAAKIDRSCTASMMPEHEQRGDVSLRNTLRCSVREGLLQEISRSHVAKSR